MKNNFDVIIIGAGSVGVPTALFLSEAGVKMYICNKENLNSYGRSNVNFTRRFFTRAYEIGEVLGIYPEWAFLYASILAEAERKKVENISGLLAYLEFKRGVIKGKRPKMIIYPEKQDNSLSRLMESLLKSKYNFDRWNSIFWYRKLEKFAKESCNALKQSGYIPHDSRVWKNILKQIAEHEGYGDALAKYKEKRTEYFSQNHSASPVVIGNSLSAASPVVCRGFEEKSLFMIRLSTLSNIRMLLKCLENEPEGEKRRLIEDYLRLWAFVPSYFDCFTIIYSAYPECLTGVLSKERLVRFIEETSLQDVRFYNEEITWFLGAVINYKKRSTLNLDNALRRILSLYVIYGIKKALRIWYSEPFLPYDVEQRIDSLRLALRRLKFQGIISEEIFNNTLYPYKDRVEEDFGVKNKGTLPSLRKRKIQDEKAKKTRLQGPILSLPLLPIIPARVVFNYESESFGYYRVNTPFDVLVKFLSARAGPSIEEKMRAVQAVLKNPRNMEVNGKAVSSLDILMQETLKDGDCIVMTKAHFYSRRAGAFIERVERFFSQPDIIALAEGFFSDWDKNMELLRRMRENDLTPRTTKQSNFIFNRIRRLSKSDKITASSKDKLAEILDRDILVGKVLLVKFGTTKESQCVVVTYFVSIDKKFAGILVVSFGEDYLALEDIQLHSVKYRGYGKEIFEFLTGIAKENKLRFEVRNIEGEFDLFFRWMKEKFNEVYCDKEKRNITAAASPVVLIIRAQSIKDNGMGWLIWLEGNYVISLIKAYYKAVEDIFLAKKVEISSQGRRESNPCLEFNMAYLDGDSMYIDRDKITVANRAPLLRKSRTENGTYVVISGDNVIGGSKLFEQLRGQRCLTRQPCIGDIPRHQHQINRWLQLIDMVNAEGKVLCCRHLTIGIFTGGDMKIADMGYKHCRSHKDEFKAVIFF